MVHIITLILPDSVRDVLERLEACGCAAYVVGGCVRDSLLGRTPNDWDIATAALPEQSMAALNGFRLLETGRKHGTITALTAEGPVEVTTFRVDGTYSDCRRPDEVRFTPSLREDLARRDFTVNALAYRPADGLCDPFGGQTDLAARVLRCVGEPDMRFGEDALRILRGLRFSAELGFSIERKTAESLLQNRTLLQGVAPERVAAELTRLLCGKNVLEVLLRFTPVITQIISELTPCVGFEQRNPYHIYTVYEHIARSVAAIPPVPALRFTMLLHDIGKPATCTTDESGRRHFHGHPGQSVLFARVILRRLRVKNALRDRVLKLVALHDIELKPTEKCVLRQLNRLGEEAFRQLLLVKRADNAAQSPAVQNRAKALDVLEQLLEEALAARRCFSLRDLAVNGGDLLAAGVPAGAAVGEALRALLALVMDGQCENEKSALLKQLENGKGL